MKAEFLSLAYGIEDPYLLELSEGHDSYFDKTR